MTSQDFVARLGVQFPILQAPLAGAAARAELVAAVSNAGGLGSLRAAYLTPSQVSETIARIRSLTDRPFNINLFAAGEPELEGDVEAAIAFLEPFHAELGIENPTLPPPGPHECLESKGYRVLVARDAAEALDLAEQHEGPIHLLMTDVVLPGIGGRELAKQLACTHPETRVLYMSGYTDNAIVHHGVLEPGIAFLQKPFMLNDLWRKVRACWTPAVDQWNHEEILRIPPRNSLRSRLTLNRPKTIDPSPTPRRGPRRPRA